MLRAIVLGCSILAVISAYPGNQPDLKYDIQQNVEACWERCFQVEDTDYERFREVYDDFYRLGAEVRRLKNVYAVNGTALLLDSTLAQFHNNPNLDYEDQAQQIWNYQLNLAQIVILLTEMDESHNPYFLAQFDHESAVGCKDFQCLDQCEAADIIRRQQISGLEMNPTSKRDGNIEAACQLTKNYINTITCDADISNEMAIAILNSGMHHHVGWDKHRKKWNGSMSPCLAHYSTRLAVGTHAADWDDMESWDSGDARSFYLHDNEYTYLAGSTLADCLFERCCDDITVWDTSISSSDCQATAGHFGETIYDISQD